MTQVVTFEAVCSVGIDQAVNQWLRDHPDVQVLGVATTATVIGDFLHRPIYQMTATVAYRIP